MIKHVPSMIPMSVMLNNPYQNSYSFTEITNIFQPLCQLKESTNHLNYDTSGMNMNSINSTQQMIPYLNATIYIMFQGVIFISKSYVSLPKQNLMQFMLYMQLPMITINHNHWYETRVSGLSREIIF
jgi:hypothetical protein